MRNTEKALVYFPEHLQRPFSLMLYFRMLFLIAFVPTTKPSLLTGGTSVMPPPPHFMHSSQWMSSTGNFSVVVHQFALWFTHGTHPVYFLAAFAIVLDVKVV